MEDLTALRAELLALVREKSYEQKQVTLASGRVSDFYVDGKQTWRSKAGGVCQVPEYILLSDEIGNWGGDISQAKLPDEFLVDYVRVYDLAEKK